MQPLALGKTQTKGQLFKLTNIGWRPMPLVLARGMIEFLAGALLDKSLSFISIACRNAVKFLAIHALNGRQSLEFVQNLGTGRQRC